MSKYSVTLLFLKVTCISSCQCMRKPFSLFCVFILPITVFLSSPPLYRSPWRRAQGYREQHRISSSGEIGISLLGAAGKSLPVSKDILYQHRLKIIVLEIEGQKLKRRHHQISHWAGWFKDNTLQLSWWWSPLDPCVCVDVKNKQTGQLSPSSPF